MARIITFYVPASYRRTPSKQAGFTGLAKVIPFPAAGRRGYPGQAPAVGPEYRGVRKILRNNGILSLIVGV